MDKKKAATGGYRSGSGVGLWCQTPLWICSKRVFFSLGNHGLKLLIRGRFLLVLISSAAVAERTLNPCAWKRVLELGLHPARAGMALVL